MEKLYIKFRRRTGRILRILMNERGATGFPGAKDSYSTKSSGDTISESHINDPQDAIVAIQNKFGIDASTPTLDKYLKGTGTGNSQWKTSYDYSSGFKPDSGGLAANTKLQLAHGLGGLPSRVEIICKGTTTTGTPNGGNPTIFRPSTMSASEAVWYGCAVNWDTTNFYIYWRTYIGGVFSTTGNPLSLNNNNSDLQFAILAWK